MKGKQAKKETKKEKSEVVSNKPLSDYQKEKGGKQDKITSVGNLR